MPPECFNRALDAFSGCRCRTCGVKLTIGELYTACSACWWRARELAELERLVTA